MKQNEIKYMIEGLSTDLALLLSRDFGIKDQGYSKCVREAVLHYLNLRFLFHLL